MRSQQADLSETRFRSIVKGFIWRGLASFTTFILVLAFTHKAFMAFELSLLEVIVKLILYYGHERTWNIIAWGRIPAVGNKTSVTVE
jgi:adenylylsulfate kinase